MLSTPGGLILILGGLLLTLGGLLGALGGLLLIPGCGSGGSPGSFLIFL